MAVIIDMVAAVAVVPIALGAVAELQLGVRNIGSSAHRAPVGISRGLLLGGLGHMKMNDLRLLLGRAVENLAELVLPGKGNDIQNVLSEEKEIVSQGNQGEKVGCGVGRLKYANQDDDQIKQGKHPCFDWNDEKQQKSRLRVQGCIAQEQAHIEVIHAGLTVENQPVNIHQHHAGEVENVEFQCAPLALHGSAQRVVAEQGNYHKENIAVPQCQGIGKQPPDFAPKDSGSVEAQKVIQGKIPCKNADEVNNGIAKNDIKHQVGNALIAVFVAEPLEISA